MNRRTLGMWLLTAVILLPALFGFATKFREFLLLVNMEEGSFAIMPIVNYLMTSFGFLLLFLAALGHGMFRDIEHPKYVMLDNERRLDEEQQERETMERWFAA